MKTNTNTYPIDSPYGSGTIHYFNIVDNGERPVNLPEMDSWSRYEAEYEIIGDDKESISISHTKTLYRKYSTIDLITTEIETINQLLGYHDNKGTDTYATIPEPTITYQRTVDGVVETKVTNEELEGWTEIDRYWLMKCTHDLQERGNPDIPMVSVEVLADGSIVVTDAVIEASDASILVDNTKNYIIDLTPQTASEEVIEKLVEDHNTVIYS